MRLPFAAAALLVATARAVELRRVSDLVPDKSFARRVAVDGAGDCFVYEGDVQYQHNGTGHAAFGEGFKHVWRTCGVWAGNKTHTLLSTIRTADGEDDDWPRTSADGHRVCYHTKDNGAASVIALVDTDAMAISYFGGALTEDWNKRKSSYCALSPDGGALVFQSSAALIKGVANPNNKYHVYVTYDHGATYVFPYPAGIAARVDAGEISFLSSYPQLAEGGRRVSFQAKVPYDDPAEMPFGLKTNELFLYDKGSGRTERLTGFNANYCNLTHVYERMQDHWGAANLTAERVNLATSTQCNLAATQGWGMNGANLLGAGHGPARMSASGRFVAYTAGFDHATVRGTHERPQVLTAANLFLHDTVLGLVWQVTGEGDVGSDFEARVEAFCCPSASASYQRGACSRKREMTGFCCWQRTCWFPAQWPDISGDGTSVAYFAAFGADEVAGDYEVMHYHIPTSTFTVLTNTTHKNHDDGYPSISWSGEVVAFDSDWDHSTDEPITDRNQAFAARLTYGCPHYVTATNYAAAPDVRVACEFPAPTAYVAGAHGVAIDLAVDLASMVANVPFYGGGSALRLCQTYFEEVRRDVAFALRVPESLLLIKQENWSSVAKCKRNVKKQSLAPGEDLGVVITFLTASGSSYEDYKEVYESLGPVSGWYEILKSKFDDPSSDFWKGYLLKTATNMFPLANMSAQNFVDNQ